MKRIRLFILIGLMGSILLTGCQKETEPVYEDSPTVQTSKDEAVESSESSQEENQTETTDIAEESTQEAKDSDDSESLDEESKEQNDGSSDEVIDEEEKTQELSSEDLVINDHSDLISGLRIMHKDNNYFGENYQGLIIGHNYEQLSLSENAKKAYPELEKAILMVNDLIATDEANNYYAAYREVMKKGEDESYDHPYTDMDWNIYVRRADKDVLSVLVEITTASYEDYNHVRYMAYNIKPDTGEVINLSDIIEDEDSLYDKLTQKFHELIKTDYEEFFAGGVEMSDSDIMKNLEKSLYEEQMVWTLDPQGVTFWLSSMNLAPVSMNCKILFGEDDKGKIFTSEFRENIPESWVTQLYPNTHELMDADDDGQQDTIYVMEKKEFYENSDNQYTAGILVDYNGKEAEFPAEGDVYNFDFSLVHQNGKSVLLSQYMEYEADIQELYKLDEGGVKKSDLLCGWLCDNPDESFSDFEEYNYITQLMTDPSSFKISVTTWLLSTADAVMEYWITDEGKFKSITERGKILEEDRYEISLKMPLASVPIVDVGTGDVTNETLDLEAGDTLKLMFTDAENYVDCLTKDNKLVRIMVYKDEDLGRCVSVNGENVYVSEVFDDMFYAG